MTANVNLTSISSISGASPITVTFLMSTLPPGDLAKVYFDFGDGTNKTVFWFASSAPASSVSSLPFSADIGNIRNYNITKIYTRPSIHNEKTFSVKISAYSVKTFSPTAYNVTVGPITLIPTSSVFGTMRLIKTKYKNENEMLLFFEDQTSGKIYSVIADPNFDASIVTDSTYQTLCSMYFSGQ